MTETPTVRCRAAHATGEDWSVAARAVAEQLAPHDPGMTVGFIYVTDSLAPKLADIVQVLRAATDIVHWTGSVGMGVYAEDREYYAEPAIAVLTMAVPGGTFELLTDLAPRNADPSAGTEPAMMAPMPVGIVHVDPHLPDLTDAVGAFADGTGAFVLGGLTSSRGEYAQVTDGAVSQGGASGVLFPAGVAVQTGLSQGCAPLGPTHRITEAADNLIMAIDGRRPMDVLAEEAGAELVQDLNALAGQIHVALVLTDSDRPDYLVRSLVGVEPMRGWLAVGDHVSVGEPIILVRRDPASAARDLEAMAASIRSRLDGPPTGGLYFSCIARGPNMFGAAGRELALIRSHLGDFPLAGFSCAGEISNGRLYGYTGVLAVFT